MSRPWTIVDEPECAFSGRCGRRHPRGPHHLVANWSRPASRASARSTRRSRPGRSSIASTPCGRPRLPTTGASAATPRAAAWRADRCQGHLRYRRLSRPSSARPCGPAARRAAMRRPWPRLRAAGAVIMGKTVTTEYAYFNPGQDPEPARPRAHAGRFLQRFGRCRRGRHGAGRHRLADQRFGDTPRRVLRCGRLQAHPRAHSAYRRAAAVARTRPCRRLRPFGRGRGPARRDIWPVSTRRIPTRAPSPGRTSVAVAASEPPLPPRFAFVRTPAWRHVEAVTEPAFAELVEAWARTRTRSSSPPASSGPSRCMASSWRSTWPTTSIATTSRGATS